jgi:hypothetical protein
VDTQVCAFREVLPEQAVGVLVRTSLPGTGRVAEVDGDEYAPGEILMAGHFGALIPRQGTAEMGRKCTHRGCQPVAEIFGTAVACEMQEGNKAACPFD